jgi:hypothetical protein
MRGASVEWVEEALASLPLHRHLDLEFTAILG